MVGLLDETVKVNTPSWGVLEYQVFKFNVSMVANAVVWFGTSKNTLFKETNIRLSCCVPFS